MQIASSDNVTSRNGLYFVLGPGLVTLATAIAFQLAPWAVPIPSQGQLLQPVPVCVTLLLGLAGVLLSRAAGLPAVPRLNDASKWRQLLRSSIGFGLAFGVALFGLDFATGLTQGAARAFGVSWINVALPESLAHYAAAAILLECVYRIFPITLFGWLIGKVLLRGKRDGLVFWTLALLTSLIEPAGQLGLVKPGAEAGFLMLLAVTSAANFFEAIELRRFGWPAPILFRLAFYGVWHCFGPYLFPVHSILYPGPH
jgi:hypothetical protein